MGFLSSRDVLINVPATYPMAMHTTATTSMATGSIAQYLPGSEFKRMEMDRRKNRTISHYKGFQKERNAISAR
jgi:hypothetical protein